jgi:hypothetical protein
MSYGFEFVNQEAAQIESFQSFGKRVADFARPEWVEATERRGFGEVERVEGI